MNVKGEGREDRDRRRAIKNFVFIINLARIKWG